MLKAKLNNCGDTVLSSKRFGTVLIQLSQFHRATSFKITPELYFYGHRHNTKVRVAWDRWSRYWIIEVLLSDRLIHRRVYLSLTSAMRFAFVTAARGLPQKRSNRGYYSRWCVDVDYPVYTLNRL